MGKVFDAISPRIQAWIQSQPVFFVATAPMAADGTINCSPKGMAGCFTVVDEHTVAYLDLTGSGVETIAHLQENGRIVLMFCAFEGPPKIVRLHGRGEVVLPADSKFQELLARFDPRPGVRAVIVTHVTRISDSCGFGVPLMNYVSDRDLLDRHAAKLGPQGLTEYHQQKNTTSIDGLPALTTNPCPQPVVSPSDANDPHRGQPKRRSTPPTSGNDTGTGVTGHSVTLKP